MLSKRLMTNSPWLLALLAFSAIFERFNVFIPSLDFSLKLSLILLPVVGLVLIAKKKLTFNPTFLFPFLLAVLGVETLSIFTSYDRFQSIQVVVFHLLMVGLFYLFVWRRGNARMATQINAESPSSEVALSEVEGDSSDGGTTTPGIFLAVVYAWLAGALVVSLYGIWQFWRFLSGGSPAIFLDKILAAKSLPATTFVHPLFGRILLRPSSTFVDTTTAASFVACAILLGLGLLLARIRKVGVSAKSVFRITESSDRSESDSSDVPRSGIPPSAVISAIRSQPILSRFLLTFPKKNSGPAVRDKRRCFFLVFSLAIFSIFFAMAFSRSAILGLGAGFIVFAILNLRERIRRRWLLGAAAISLIALLGLIVWLSLWKFRAVSNITRVEIAKGAIEMCSRNPLLGMGVGNFESYYTEVLKPGKRYGYSHSSVLTWLGETGILGVVSNLALIGVVIFALVRESLRHGPGSTWRLRLSALLGAFVALVTTNILHAHYGSEFTWVLLGLCVSGYYQAKAAGSRQQAAVRILRVGVDNVTMGEAIRKVKEFFKSGKKTAVFTPNPEMVMRARSDPAFAEILNKADLAIPDGIGLVWASRIFGTPLKERVTGTDLFLELCAEAARRKGRVFLLGGQERIAEKAARVLKKRYPKLRIVGIFAGDGSPKGDSETVAVVQAAIQGSEEVAGKTPASLTPGVKSSETPGVSPAGVKEVFSDPSSQADRAIDLLFVAYGHGKQERWISRNLEKVSVKVAMGVGGAFDFVAGEVPRAPKIVRRLGFEWLFRLIRQPWRIRRQMVILPFAALVFKEALRKL